ncbi:MAG: carboxypeptidase regulatory-like domain-containing protein [Deltaproteobacteria bacterium]|nr:carboxypeptidase regulatory-like domain-containing protein [Deltaproteobacteria bacterium]
MRKLRGWLPVLITMAVVTPVAGCSHNRPTHVDGGVLGRVVIYRNGVAFYERHARVEDGRVSVRVPRDRVDDFLKSLTVVDPTTRKPLSVTIPRKEADDGSYLTMTLETPDRKQARVLLTYVTEAPAWKPSYRVVVGTAGKVMLEGWAIVDNTTSEDWKGVLVGVGASSALAFRYDLWSVRQIDRDLLAGEEKFAIAPPTALSPYSETSAEELASLDASELRTDARGEPMRGATASENTYVVDGAVRNAGAVRGVVSDARSGEKLAGVTIMASSAANNISNVAVITDEAGNYQLENLPPGSYSLEFYYADTTVKRNVTVQANNVTPVFQKLKQSAGGEVIRITDSAPSIDPTSTRQGVTIISKNYTKLLPVPGRSFGQALGSAAGSYSVDGVNTGGSGSYEAPKPPPPVQQGDAKLKAIAQRVIKDKRDVVIEVRGARGTEAQASARGTAVKNKLVDDGVPASRIHIVPKLGDGEPEAVRVVAVAPQPKEPAAQGAARIPAGDTPVGESHFMADRPMTVRSGSSAMVSIMHGETTGGVVYVFDPISERGDQRFAFKAVRLDNPTGDTLEPGPVTVYGDGRFIGEGITEPVPPHAAVVVPFALDKQIVVERTGSEEDRIAKLVTVQRGVVTAEVQHRRNTRFVVTSRLAVPTTVYLRHRLEAGWTLVEAPGKPLKVGDSQLFAITVAAGETTRVTIAEATPVQRTFDLSSDAALGMMKVFIAEPEASPRLRAQIEALLATHRGAADLGDRIQTLRDQLGEYRSRSGELHAQVVTLKAVRTGGDLMASLRTKLAEMSDRVQRATIEIVETQEKLMLARVKFQNQLADLKLTDVTAPELSRR